MKFNEEEYYEATVKKLGKVLDDSARELKDIDKDDLLKHMKKAQSQYAIKRIDLRRYEEILFNKPKPHTKETELMIKKVRSMIHIGDQIKEFMDLFDDLTMTITLLYNVDSPIISASLTSLIKPIF